MKARDGIFRPVRFLRVALAHALFLLALLLAPLTVRAAPFAALVMDARSGAVLYETNADARLYPASLTKMLTLYIAFDAIKRGEISLDTMVTVSANAANEPPSRLGLRAGQKIALRYLIRAAAVKSANDAATAIGEAIGGSESGFADRMNRTARALGMKNSTFRNANGLTLPGHLSTARDMAILGRHLFYDFPEYYNLFSRRTTDAGLATVTSTNKRFLDAYEGADGIKTGYTSQAGFNLVASAQRGDKRLIGVIFGGTSTAQRNAKMAELLDMGFSRAPARVAVVKPKLPNLDAIAGGPAPADTPPDTPDSSVAAAVVAALEKSPVPRHRPGAVTAADLPADVLAEMKTEISNVVAEVQADGNTGSAAAPVALSITPAPRPGAAPAPAAAPPAAETRVAEADPEVAPVVADSGEDPEAEEVAGADATEAPVTTATAEAPAPVPAPEPIPAASPAPAPRPGRDAVIFAKVDPAPAPEPAAPEIVTRFSTSGGHDWGITLGRFNTRDAAERTLLKTALVESTVLRESLRKVVSRGGGFEATFAGLTQDQADLACRRLQARGNSCFTLSP